MIHYLTYMLKINLQSPIITPFHSDTIFGHFAWALKYLKGEQKLTEFLRGMNNEPPPLLISNGFPKDLLPRPVGSQLSEEDEEKLKNLFIEKGGSVEYFYKALKTLKKVPYIHKDVFAQLIDDYSTYELYQKVIKGEISSRNFYPFAQECRDIGKICFPFKKDEKAKICKKKGIVETEIIAHNTINRLTNTTGEGGGFFQQEEDFYEPGQEFNIYVRCQGDYVETVKLCFQYIADSGFGKDKSTGKGHFEIVSWESETEDKKILPECKNPNAFMSLSNMIPSEKDPTDARYNLITKYGRLGGDWAKSAYPDNENGEKSKGLVPFKTPLLMFEAGAVFSLKNGKPEKEYLGCMMKNVHRYKEIVQYAYGFPLYFREVRDGK